MPKKNILIGAHMSIAGGMHKAIERGAAIGCTTIQIFTKSNRQWYAKPLPEKDIHTFKDVWKKSPIELVVVHASYLINIGSPNKETAQKSLNALVEEVERCHALSIPYLVLHPGAHLTSSKEECLDLIVHNLNIAIKKTSHCKVTIALETMAGQGSNVCDSFQDIAYIIKNISNKSRIGVTFDTCHVFSAGYNIATTSGYTKTLDAFNSIIGINHLKVIHLNDSKRELGSHVDRHEHIGVGKVGLECFKHIMRDKRLITIPKILETPNPDQYEKEIAMLKNMLS